jgi:hypothetical protein
VYSYPTNSFDSTSQLASQGIFFTYDVIWKLSEKKFGTAWDEINAFSWEEIIDEFAVFGIVCVGLLFVLKYGINSFVKKKI